MNKAPRASLSISMLRDQDYTGLMKSSEGREAFAVFVALVMAGRERLTESRATQVGTSDALRLEDNDEHLEIITGIKMDQVEIALKTLESVANTNSSKTWVFRDESGRLTIRSFFKYNVNREWGGARPGAGRKIQDEFKMESTRIQLELSPSPSPSPSPTTYSCSDVKEKLNKQSPAIAGRHTSDSRSGYERVPEFVRFWNAFPRGRKSGKQKALEAWHRAVKRADASTIIDAAERYAKSPAGTSEFVKMPATWLNGGCWEDDPAAWGLADKPSRPRILTDDEVRSTKLAELQHGDLSDAG